MKPAGVGAWVRQNGLWAVVALGVAALISLVLVAGGAISGNRDVITRICDGRNDDRFILRELLIESAAHPDPGEPKRLTSEERVLLRQFLKDLGPVDCVTGKPDPAYEPDLHRVP